MWEEMVDVRRDGVMWEGWCDVGRMCARRIVRGEGRYEGGEVVRMVCEVREDDV